MVNFTILAGGYSSFVATYNFDASAGVLEYTGQSQTGVNPSWLSRHLTNPDILYAVNQDRDNSGIGESPRVPLHLNLLLQPFSADTGRISGSGRRVNVLRLGLTLSTRQDGSLSLSSPPTRSLNR